MISPQPLASMPRALCQGLRGIFTDIDDTLTTEGRLPAEAYAALWDAHEAGLLVVPVTGRPAGWCDLIARLWPIDGVVGENGALYYRLVGRKMRRFMAVTAEEMAAQRHRLDRIAQAVLHEVPGTALAADQPFRLADLAVDIAEEVSPLDREAIARIVAIFQREGATAKVSSIHVNGWFGGHDKLSMVRRYMAEEHGLALEQHLDRFLFVGDSPNDEPMFRFFSLSAGPANVMDMADIMTHLPAYVASLRGGEGFKEIVDRVLEGRAP